MEEVGGGRVSTFPVPPMEYVKLYSNENVSQGTAPPPPPPIMGHYTMFGTSMNTEDDIVQTLDAQGIRRLYPQGSFDHKAELKKLNRSILANFLDLLEILIRCPASAEKERKLEELKLLFINMHHLINEYRSHQARETLRLMLEVQYQERMEIVKRFRAHFDVVSTNLKRCLVDVPEDVCSTLAVEFQQQSSNRILHPAPPRIAKETANVDVDEENEASRLDDLMCKRVDDQLST